MKRLLMALLALALAFVMTAGALAEGLEIASESNEAVVPEIEVELVAPNDDEEEEDPEYLIPVDAKNFPDGVFRAYISQNYDMDQDGYLDEDEVDYVDAIVVDGLGVTSLTGIENFYNLITLSCSENRGLTSIDVSQNVDLGFLNCKNCSLTSLNLKGFDMLDTLYCSGNPLTELDLTGCEGLATLCCDGIPSLKSLILKGCECLMLLDCSGTGITSLDLNGCESLISVCANECSKLESVNLKDAEELTAFGAMNTALTKLDIKNNTELRFLSTIGCKIDSIDISECTVLVNAVKKNEPVCDGACTHFGAQNTSYESDAGTLTGYPIDVWCLTKLVSGGKVVYEPKIWVQPTGSVLLEKGKTKQLGVVFSPEGMVFYDGGKVTWKSSNAKIASIDKDGVVKGRKDGVTVTITATSAWGAKATVDVTVIPIQPTGVKLNKKTVNLKITKKNKTPTVKLKAKLSPKGAKSKLTWSSSDKKVATVDKNGKVKAVGKGTAVITVATENGLTASVKINVKVSKK